MKIVLCFIVTFHIVTTLNVVNCVLIDKSKINATFYVIVGDNDGKVSRIRSNSPNESTLVYQFSTQAITALARYKTKDGKNKLFVA